MCELSKMVYAVGIVTVGTTAAGYISKKAFGVNFETPNSLKGTVKLGVGIGLGRLIMGLVLKPSNCGCKKPTNTLA